MPLSRYNTGKAAAEICDYCCGEDNWYIIESKYVENEPYIPLDYGHDYYIDKETGLILIKRVYEYDYMCWYPAILLTKGMKDYDQH